MERPLSLAYGQTAPPKGEPRRWFYCRPAISRPQGGPRVARRSRDREGGVLCLTYLCPDERKEAQADRRYPCFWRGHNRPVSAAGVPA